MTFVAVDADGHALAVAPVVPETPDEIRRYNEALVRREARIALGKSLTAR
jgi:acyl-CoA hydrolase